MSIQSNINQGLSLMSLLISQTPGAAAKREEAVQTVAERKAQEKVATEAAEKEQRYQALQEHAQEGIKKAQTAADQEAELEVYGDFSQIAKERYLANPTKETYQDYIDAATGYREGKQSFEEKKTAIQKQREAAQKAKESLAADQERLAQFRQQMLGGQAPTYNVREVIKYGKE